MATFPKISGENPRTHQFETMVPITYERFRNRVAAEIIVVSKTSKVAISDGRYCCGDIESVRLPSW